MKESKLRKGRSVSLHFTFPAFFLRPQILSLTWGGGSKDRKSWLVELVELVESTVDFFRLCCMEVARLMEEVSAAQRNSCCGTSWLWCMLQKTTMLRSVESRHSTRGAQDTF